MAKHRIVNTRFWEDNYIAGLDPTEKLLFLYFLTNPHTDICGIYEIPLKTIAVDSGIDKEMVEKILNRFSKDNKIFYIDGWIIIKNFVKHQAINPSVEKGIERCVSQVPQTILDRLGTDWVQRGPLNLTKLNLTYNVFKKKMYNENKHYEEPIINLQGESLVPDKKNQNEEWAKFLVWWEKKVLNLGVKNYRAQTQDKVLFHKRIKEFGQVEFKKIVTFYLESDRVERLIDNGDIPTIAAALSAYALIKYANR